MFRRSILVTIAVVFVLGNIAAEGVPILPNVCHPSRSVSQSESKDLSGKPASKMYCVSFPVCNYSLSFFTFSNLYFSNYLPVEVILSLSFA